MDTQTLCQHLNPLIYYTSIIILSKINVNCASINLPEKSPGPWFNGWVSADLLNYAVLPFRCSRGNHYETVFPAILRHLCKDVMGVSGCIRSFPEIGQNPSSSFTWRNENTSRSALMLGRLSATCNLRETLCQYKITQIKIAITTGPYDGAERHDKVYPARLSAISLANYNLLNIWILLRK